MQVEVLMQSISLHAHVGKDGVLKLQTPIKYRDVEVDITLTVNLSPAKGKGWPPGFFEQTFGCIPDFPDRAPQGEYEIRDALE
jgi:hypothetical protein